jgi:uncharacterized membrane protein YccC
MLFSVASTTLAIFCMGMIWIGSGWADGASAVAIGAIAICLFAAQDEPARVIRSFFRWNLACLIIAMIYLFLLLPNAHDFELLVAMFAPPYLIFGLMITQPKLALMGMPLALFTSNDIGLQGAYNADFAAFFNSNVAGIAGILFALLWTLLTRPFGATFAARRLVRASWGDIARNATGRGPDEHARLHARTLDRLGQLVPRLSASGDALTTDGFAEVRIELSTLVLQRCVPALAPDQQRAIRRILHSIAKYYQGRLNAKIEAPPRALEETLSKAIRRLASRIDPTSREVCAALVELRIALFSPA